MVKELKMSVQCGFGDFLLNTTTMEANKIFQSGMFVYILFRSKTEKKIFI